ncbi:hypothetical protein Mal48_01680 [Thalassoglobus polymorphus]|uniref:Uncharacterized protein n=1 Tax=Thalassoglobus polymorphus TaxID=2527994 RepID=A0A517QH31_9PLAN|nr:hypothetical protein Mal48_01680 [Thalassoglobus polymorphus]
MKQFTTRQVLNAQKEGGKGWKFLVNVSYSSSVDEPVKDILSVPASITTSTATVRRIVTTDHEGRPLLNKAGQLIEGVEDEFDLLVFDITKNIPDHLPSWVGTHRKAINADSVSIDGFPCLPKTLQVGSFQVGGRQYHGKQSYRAASIKLVHNEQTWVRTLLNAGTMELRWQEVPGHVYPPKYKAVLRPIVDDAGENISSPQLLSKDGAAYRVDPLTGKVVPFNKQKGLFSDLLKIKTPLEPKEIVTLEYTLKKPRPFNGVLPIR